MRKRLAQTLIAAALAWTGVAKAAPIIELALVIDVSGSISASDFSLQKQAYVNALSNASILPANGTVAIGVYQFASTVITRLTPLTISTAADRTTLIAAINAITDTGGGTAIGDAITVASNDLLGNAITSQRQIIDVSTDGQSNVGSNDVTAATNAVAAGIDQINCLGVGGAANCNFIRGVGSFSTLAANFAAFQTALETKLTIETSVPEPATLTILGMGMLALGAVRRRRRN